MIPISRAGLTAKPTLPDALAALVDAAAWLDAHGCQPVLEERSAVAAGVPQRWMTAPREDLPERVDVVIAFGGDGTLLDAAGAVAHSTADVPLLGVNLGHLGFLTEVGRAELTTAMEALLAGRTRTETRLLLDGRLQHEGREVASRVALNDIVVTRGPLSRMIEIDVSIDDQFLSHVKADGLIVATATGSTAYNLSAGGPILHPSVDAFVVTPIAAHTLTNRPIVLPATATVTMRPTVDASPSDLVITFDGQHGVPFGRDDVVIVRRAPRVLRFVRTTSRTHFEMLREKLKWGNA